MRSKTANGIPRQVLVNYQRTRRDLASARIPSARRIFLNAPR